MAAVLLKTALGRTRAARSIAPRLQAPAASRAAVAFSVVALRGFANTALAPVDDFEPVAEIKTLFKNEAVRETAATYVLTGGGTGVGSHKYVGRSATYTGESSRGWCKMRLVSSIDGTQDVSDVISWRRPYLRRRLPDGTLAADAPTLKELKAAAVAAALPPAAV